ncbi:hypothetical protein HK096_003068 [Nowakowskiella sp. JEL0078]|nr:hypothetical protein HK096_003068 [Nowakowskiella sp. JEL0078]
MNHSSSSTIASESPSDHLSPPKPPVNRLSPPKPLDVSSPKKTDIQQPKAKNKKMKKSIYAVILASGPAVSIAYPTYFSFISSLRFRSPNKPILFPSSRPDPSSDPQPPTIPANLESGRRTQSFSFLPTNPDPAAQANTPYQQNYLESSISVPDDEDPFHDIDTDLMECPEAPNPQAQLMLRKPQSHRHTSKSPRRIQSAPSVASTTHCFHSLLENDDDDKDDDSEGISDNNGNSHSSFIVESVKAKIALRKEVQDEARLGGFENWDADFEISDVDLAVPQTLIDSQVSVKTDVENVRNYALHIEDLKLLYLNATDMSSGLQSDPNQKENVNRITTLYERDLEQVKVLIEISECADDDDSNSHLTYRTMEVLSDILSNVAHKLKDQEKISALSAAAAARQIAKDQSTTTRFLFGVELMPTLIKQIGPLKQSLRDYVAALRKLVLMKGI